MNKLQNIMNVNENSLNDYSMRLDIIFETQKSDDQKSTKSLLKQEASEQNILLDLDYDDYCEFVYSMIRRDEFELGYVNETIRFLEREVSKNKDYALKALQQILLKHSKEKEIWIAILQILSSLTYEESEPYSVYIAASCLAKKDIEIKEMAVNLFEQWSNKEAIEFLEDMGTGVIWLDKYIKNVIEDIKMEMEIYGVSY